MFVELRERKKETVIQVLLQVPPLFTPPTHSLHMHPAAQVGVGWIWDERSITGLLSGEGGVFCQLKSSRLADFCGSF